MKKRIIKELSYYMLSSLIVWCCFQIINQSNTIIIEVKSAIERCINVIIPSLFSFIVISGIIIKSGIYQYIVKPFYPITRYIIRMPNSLFFVFLLGNISGYPIGSKLLLDLNKQSSIDKKTAEIMNCFCYGGGPAFFAGVIGISIYNSSAVGIIIFISNAISNLLLAVILCRILRVKCKDDRLHVSFSADMITDSIVDAGKSLFIICVTIISFAFVIALLEAKGLFSFIATLGVNENWLTVIKSVLEISYISNTSTKSVDYIPVIAGICSFGGVCVLMQIKALVKNSYSLKLFIFTRIITSFMSVIICKIILYWFEPDILPAISSKAKLNVTQQNILPSICLVAMILIVAFSDRQRKRKAALTLGENSLKVY